MEDYFSVCNFQIPTELKSLYQEVSNTFETTLRDAVRENKGKTHGDNNEKIKKIS